jgi:putative peptidoglycan lipid II flippase
MMSGQKNLLHHATWVGFLTLISRITGVWQSRILAAYLGNEAAADAFSVAWRLPNMLRRLTAEGVMTAAFLPTLNEVEGQEGEAGAKALAARFLGTLGTLLLVVCTVGVASMGLITGLLLLGRMAPGASLPEQFSALFRVLSGAQTPPPTFALTTLLSRLMFPYLVLVSLTAGLGAVLNFRDRFALPASVSTLWNLVFIGFAKACFHWGPPAWRDEQVAAIVFAGAVIAGGLAQLFALWPTFRSLGFGLNWGLHFGHPGVRLALRRMGPGIVGAGIHPINVLISASLASQLAVGSQIVLYNSNMLGEMVLGLFAVSVATVSLPALSRLAEVGDSEGFRASLVSALRGSALLTIPGALGLAVLAQPIIAFIFQTGRFDAGAVAWTAKTLAFQTVGLLFIATSRITAQALYALKDYRSPALAGVVGLGANVLFSILLMRPFGTGGIALANGLASFIGLAFLVTRLAQRMDVPFAPVLKGWGLMLVGALPMGLLAWWGAARLELWTFRSMGDSALRLFPLVGVCGALYFGIVLLLGLDEARALGRKLLRKQ